MLRRLAISNADTDITPVSNHANLEYSLPRPLPNWTIDAEERRWFYLRLSPSDARFISHVSRGIYAVKLVFEFKFSEHVTPELFEDLRKGTLGTLIVVAGTPTNRSKFFNDPLAESTEIRDIIKGSKTTRALKIPSTISEPTEIWEVTVDHSTISINLGMGSMEPKAVCQLGIFVKWSDVKYFENEDPILLMSLKRLE